MSRMNDGGSAFPQTEYYDDKPIGSIGGMSLRDYFAAAYLKGIAARASTTAPEVLADSAYNFADALLERRRK